MGVGDKLAPCEVGIGVGVGQAVRVGCGVENGVDGGLGVLVSTVWVGVGIADRGVLVGGSGWPLQDMAKKSKIDRTVMARPIVRAILTYDTALNLSGARGLTFSRFNSTCPLAPMSQAAYYRTWDQPL